MVHSMFDSADMRQQLQALSAPALQKLFRVGDSSIVEVTQFFLDRIAASDPVLGALIAVNPEALLVAETQQQKLSRGETLGPLFGIPILVKDNIETAELPTTAGSLALELNHSKKDAVVIEQLRGADAIILGKANLSEWANFRSTSSISGWSAKGGQTRNPHDLSRTPCGSSAGSGAGVAALLGMMAVGTETDGSITCPASINGVVGFKPTVGMVSQEGIVPISNSQDTAGPMTRNVIDAAVMVQVMSGGLMFGVQALDQLIHMNGEGAKDLLSGTRFGVLDVAKNGFAKPTLDCFDQFLGMLSDLGSELSNPLRWVAPDDFRQDMLTVLLYEFRKTINAYLVTCPGSVQVRSLAELIQFNLASATETRWFGQELFELAENCQDRKLYHRARENIQRSTREQGIDHLLNESGADFLIAPTSGPGWCIDNLLGDRGSGGTSSLAAVAGYPSVTIPMGKVHHMPVGVSLIGRAKDDDKLLQIARSIEMLLPQNVQLEVDPW